MTAVIAMLAALLGRARTGQGATLDLSMQEAALYWVMLPGAGPKLALSANTAVPSVGRVALDGVPITGAPLVLWLYEALDAVSVDREMLGSVRIDPLFLGANLGPFTLEVTMMQNFSLEIAVRAQGGPREKLTLTAPKAKPAAATT